MQISNFLLPVLTTNETINKLHRSWTIQGHHSDNVFKMCRLKSTQIALHTSGLKLEHACRVTALEQLIRLFIIKRQ